MFTKPLLVIALLVFVCAFGIRLYSHFSAPGDSNHLNGVVSSLPKENADQLAFTVNNQKVKARRTSLNVGDKVFLEGEIRNNVFYAKKVTLVEPDQISRDLSLLRNKLFQKIENSFPEPQASLLAGVLLGIKTDLSKEFKESLIRTGTIHVVVVSGYNITLIGSFFLVFAPYSGRKKASLAALVAIILYTLLVGSSAPTLRATLMGIAALSAVLIGRQYLALYYLAAVGSLLIFIDPNNIFDISFQLTFFASLGLILFSQRLQKLFQFLPWEINEPLSTTLSASVLVIPLIFYYFGNISLLSPLVNVLVLWTVPTITVLGMAFLVTSFISPFLAGVLSLLLMIPLTFFTQIVQNTSNLSFLFVQIPSGNLDLLVGYYLIITATFYYLKIKRTELGLLNH